MQLKSIKLAGFKSFVDPTVLEVRSNLVGVVGPNGCGKSNVIDAVRWVMGESSAKHLRGESMSDVIFNGSTTRKPVGQASIELIFDNSDGSLKGEYAAYNEISVRRQATRDGQVSYFLNGTRCRRKDVTDIFLGTGLGPRSYAIIEQGMISRVIESKPEDLRAFFEEAAGIALYKKRRQETELRMRHTRENLQRIEDLIQEIDKLIDKLKKQSESAIRFKEYRKELDLLEAKLTALRWKTLDEEQATQKTEINLLSNQLEQKNALKSNNELNHEKIRLESIEKQDIFNEVQTRFYELKTKIAGQEQSIEHHLEKGQQLNKALEDAKNQSQQLQEQLRKDKIQLEALTDEQEQIAPLYLETEELLKASQLAQEQAEEALKVWNENWETFQTKSLEAQGKAELHKSRIEQFDKQARDAEQRIQRLKQEAQEFKLDDLENQYQDKLTEKNNLQKSLDIQNGLNIEIVDKIKLKQSEIKDTNGSINETRSILQVSKGKLASLKALQEAALKKSSGKLKSWLEQNNLHQNSRLAEVIEVESGYEKAVETVLSQSLDAICIDDFNDGYFNIEHLAEGNVNLLARHNSLAQTDLSNHELLLSKIKNNEALQSLLMGIYVVSDLNQAKIFQTKLKAHESVITQDGIWLGPNWLKVLKGQDNHVGVIEREKELKNLMQVIEQNEIILKELSDQLENLNLQLDNLEQEKVNCQKELNDLNRQYNKINAETATAFSKIEHAKSRLKRIELELSELAIQLTGAIENAGASRALLQEFVEAMDNFNQKRHLLQSEKDQLKQNLQKTAQATREHKDKLHQFAIQKERIKTQHTGVIQGIERLESQNKIALEKQEALTQSLNDFDEPLIQLRTHLDELLSAQLIIDKELNQARHLLHQSENDLLDNEKERMDLEKIINKLREQLEKAKLQWQTYEVKRENLTEKLQEVSFTLEELLQFIQADELDEETYESSINQISNKIQRLGSINLSAIEEYQTEFERKSYLDLQQKDLVEALTTLENAIQKIDKETRTKFRETFDKVNSEFQTLFPRLFGGGQAYLDLVGDDLLEAGVSVMARPPGKRNSSIHLLSGGEKALTAVALVFSIFQLNPAPFCMLDEVDAPLDDANVGRFCELVKHMSQSVQFIFISHNKLAMEMANQLCGVTMKEPGVSRLVSVDVEAAVALIAS